MSPENTSTNAVAELRHAEERFLAADLLLRAGLLADAISCAYGADLHTIRALLFTVGQEPRTRLGALHLFKLHFIVPGKLPAQHLAALTRAGARSASADDDPQVQFELAEAQREVTDGRALFAAAQTLIV